MLFQKIYFFYDRNGVLRDKPLLLKASHVRAAGFYLNTAEYRSSRARSPALHVCRTYKNLKTDPYNEDGRPPSVWTIMVYPHVEFQPDQTASLRKAADVLMELWERR